MRALKDKSAESLVRALDSIKQALAFPRTLPRLLQTDYDRAFVSQKFKDYLEQNGVLFMGASGVHKARSSENYLRSAKKILIPLLESRPEIGWPEAIEKVQDAMNRRYNARLGMSPDQALGRWRAIQQRYLEEEKPPDYAAWRAVQDRLKKGGEVSEDGKHFALGQTVFVPFKPDKLAKHSDRQFRYQVYKIKEIRTDRRPYLYKVEDGLGHRLGRLFYAKELRKAAPPEYYPVSAIKATKTVKGIKYHLVSFQDHSQKFDQWLPAANVRQAGADG